MEASAARFAAVLEGSPTLEQLSAMKQQLEGRFRFLWGIYRAHSEVSVCPVPANCCFLPSPSSDNANQLTAERHA